MFPEAYRFNGLQNISSCVPPVGFAAPYVGLDLIFLNLSVPNALYIHSSAYRTIAWKEWASFMKKEDKIGKGKYSSYHS